MSENRAVEGTTWSVVCTTIEPPALIEIFAAHHLAVGASQVFIFLDEAADAALLPYAPDSPVTIVACDERHWAGRRGGRPDDHRHRQAWNAEVAARKLARTDWIASIDADEMVQPRSCGSIAALLAQVPQETGVVRLSPAERMFVGHRDEAGLDIGGVFKLASAGLGRRLYGQEWGRLLPNGLQGHDLGKSFRRTGSDRLRFRIHRVFDGQQEALPLLVPTREAALLHLFPASFVDWRSKYGRRLAAPQVLADIRPSQRARFEAFGAVAEAEGEEGVRALFDRLCVLPPVTAKHLLEEGLAFAAPLPAPAEARTMLGCFRLPHPPAPIVRSKPVVADLRAWLVGMEPGDGADLCRLLAAKGYGDAFADEGGGGGALRRGTLDDWRGGHVRGPLGLDINLLALADLDPEAVLVVNRRPLTSWLAGMPAPRAARLEQLWERRRSDLRILRGRGRLVLDWAVETEKPSRMVQALETLWSTRGGKGTEAQDAR